MVPLWHQPFRNGIPLRDAYKPDGLHREGDGVSEGGERPVRVAPPRLLLSVEQGLEVCRRIFGTPVVAEDPHPIPGQGLRPSASQGGLHFARLVGPDSLDTEAVGVVLRVEAVQGAGLVFAHAGAHRDPARLRVRTEISPPRRAALTSASTASTSDGRYIATPWRTQRRSDRDGAGRGRGGHRARTADGRALWPTARMPVTAGAHQARRAQPGSQDPAVTGRPEHPSSTSPNPRPGPSSPPSLAGQRNRAGTGCSSSSSTTPPPPQRSTPSQPWPPSGRKAGLARHADLRRHGQGALPARHAAVASW